MQTVKHIDLDMDDLVKEGTNKATYTFLISATELRNGMEQTSSNEAKGLKTRITYERRTALYKCYLNDQLKKESQNFEQVKWQYTFYIGKHEMDLHPKKYSVGNNINLQESIEFHTDRLRFLNHKLDTL